MTESWQVFPSEFIERLKQFAGEARATEILNVFCGNRPTTLRANTLKITADELKKTLTEAGIDLDEVSWWKNAFIVRDRALKQVHHPLYVSGGFYVQGLSSMLPPLILDPQPNEKILDVSAAPGSKTTQMATLMNNTGEIIANDISPVRLFKLQANLKNQGVENTFTRKGPGQYIWHRYPEYFDRTLVDVPCSMEGRFDCSDPDSYADWSLKKVKELANRQSHILRGALTATKPGGIVVYSTCTLAPEENEGVIQWLLEKEAGKVELMDIELPGLEMTSGLTSWQGKEFDPQLQKTRRIYPTDTMEGFFIAKLRKIASNIPEPQPSKFHHRRFQTPRHRKNKMK